MIRLTRLNGRPFVLNAEQIKSIEQTPDTLVHLLNGEQIMVREDMDEVVRRAIEFLRSVRVFPLA
jgi:flagellar protein FlbD